MNMCILVPGVKIVRWQGRTKRKGYEMVCVVMSINESISIHFHSIQVACERVMLFMHECGMLSSSTISI